jgi:protein phosphatase
MFAEIGRTIPIPTFSEETIRSLCDAAQRQFESMETVLDVTAPYYIIGDIHGNIFDLIRIIQLTCAPPSSRLLFLGDYVDRGDYSIEVITLLLSLFAMYPENVILLRGNHEFENVNTTYGFHAEVMARFQSRQLFEAFNRVFLWMPLVAVVNEVIFCVHGGIAPSLTSLHDIRRLRRPLLTCEVDPISDLVWSDPTSDCETYSKSVRGLGVQFGVQGLEAFLAVMGMRKLIRAHQCVQAGVSKFANDQLYTVFSCSAYEGTTNHCGLLFMDRDLQIECFSLPPIEQIPKKDALIRTVEHDEIISAALATNPFSLKMMEIQKSSLKTSARKMIQESKSKDSARDFQPLRNRARPQPAKREASMTHLPQLCRPRLQKEIACFAEGDDED